LAIEERPFVTVTWAALFFAQIGGYSASSAMPRKMNNLIASENEQDDVSVGDNFTLATGTIN
jgi:hypothetical protein